MKRDTARRLTALESALQPQQEIIWNRWQILLAHEEYSFVSELLGRGATCAGEPDQVDTWRDDWAAWRLLCDGERELALLASIEAKAGEAGLDLWPHLHDLSL